MKQLFILWTIEEALKCEGLTAIVGGISTFDLIQIERAPGLF